jgi:hypothetical protein
MPSHILRLWCDVLAARSAGEVQPDAHRVLYVREGAVTIRSARQVATLSANSAWHGSTGCGLTAGADGAVLLRWELLPVAIAIGNGAQPLLERGLELDAQSAYLMRCDRVDFPLGGIAYTHTHRGPGIRCLLTGAIVVKVAGDEHRVSPGQAWFEAGPDPVLALASEQALTSFARVMILPVELRGKSSIRYVLPEDQDKPKRQTYQLFVDDPIQL